MFVCFFYVSRGALTSPKRTMYIEDHRWSNEIFSQGLSGGPYHHRRGSLTSRIVAAAMRSSPSIWRRASPPLKRTLNIEDRRWSNEIVATDSPSICFLKFHYLTMFCFFMYLGEPDHHWRGWLGVQDRRWINEVRRPSPKFTFIRTTGKKDGTVEYCQIGIRLLYFILWFVCFTNGSRIPFFPPYGLQALMLMVSPYTEHINSLHLHPTVLSVFGLSFMNLRSRDACF